jgi:tetratricopeptide (TPR) repeat protein
VDAYELGGALNGVGASAAAAVFLERSLATALTDEDRQRIQGMSQVFVTRPDEHFRGWTKQELVEVYQALQRPDLAQPLVEDLVKADLAGGGPAFYVARLAGTVQAASGERGVETLILAEEAAKPDSPEYWLARGEYFGGRREDVAAREAFDKALALAPPEAADGPRQKSGTLREQVLRSYVSYLRRSDQTPPAVALVRTELRIAAPDTGTRNWALWSLHAIDVELPKAHVIRADDELLWRVLANSPRWDAPEEHCLAGMLLQATGRERHAANARAQALCRGTDPSRALALGSFFAHWKADQMAVPLLRDAIHRLSGPERREERERAQSTLFGAYLHLKRAREAEQQFAGVAARLTADEIPVRLADLAVLAAQTGDAVGAMRLWRRVVNLDGTALGDLPALVSAGLSPKLTSFYREWQKRDSESWVPAAALKILAQRHQPAHPKASSPR